ncbi:MAG: helix-turn-helix domain-containing protein [Vicinamibacterales bacterium]
MVYEEYLPPVRLADVVAAFWRFELDGRDPDTIEHAIPPDGCVSIAVALSSRGVERIAVVGPRLSALRVPVHQGIRYVGVRTTPGGSSAVLGMGPRSLRERVVPLRDMAPSKHETLCAAVHGDTTPDALIDGLVRVVDTWVGSAAQVDSVALAMVGRILQARGQGPVRAITTEGTGLSYRQGLRRFVDAVGLSPKELARLTRLRDASIQVLASEGRSWADVSAATGFADQSHMNREFSEVYGWPPRLVREYLRRIEHIHVKR